MEFLANPDLKNVAALATAATKVLVVDGANNTIKTNTPAQIVTGLDGDKGDITVSASGATWTIDNDVVTYAKMQNVSATSRVLGRKTAGSGDTEECTLSEVLDFVGSAAQGDILYRNATTWTRLGAGTNNQYLKTQGPNANPVWADVSGSGNKSFQASLLGSQGGGDPTSANQIYINTGTTGYGWPHDGVDNQATSLLKATKFVIPFNPTNYRFSFLCAGNSSYSGSPTSGDFGIKFRYSTNNSTWTDIATITFGSRSIGDFVTASGSLSISGSPSLVYIMTEQTNSLSPSSDGYIYIRNLIADFWT